MAVTDRTSPTPSITFIGSAWHRRRIWRYRPTPLESVLRSTEVSVRLLVMRQIPTPSFPKVDIVPLPVFGTKRRFRISARITCLAELFKHDRATCGAAFWRHIRPSARRATADACGKRICCSQDITASSHRICESQGQARYRKSARARNVAMCHSHSRIHTGEGPGPGSSSLSTTCPTLSSRER